MHRFKKYILLLSLIAAFPLCTQAAVVNKVVAIVNDEVITQHDVDQLLAILYAQQVQAYKEDELLQKMEELKKDILRQIIEDKLILSRAKELDVKVREADVNEKLRHVKSGFDSEEDFYKMLEAQGITVANLKARYTDQIMMKKLVDSEIRSRVSVLPSEISDYYERHRQEFMRDEKRKVSHILIKAKGDVSFELARVEMKKLYDKLKSGADFDELAKEYSQGPNKEQGGDMGYIGRGEMLEGLDKVVFSLKEGEVSMPVKSRIGYHIFKVTDIKNAGYFKLDDAKDAIKKMLFQEKFKKRLKEWLDGLRSKAYIDIK